MFYKIGGSKVSVRPDAGYTMTVTDVNGVTRVMTNNLSWDIVYDATSGKWYFHTIDPGQRGRHLHDVGHQGLNAGRIRVTS